MPTNPPPQKAPRPTGEQRNPDAVAAMAVFILDQLAVRGLSVYSDPTQFPLFSGGTNLPVHDRKGRSHTGEHSFDRAAVARGGPCRLLRGGFRLDPAILCSGPLAKAMARNCWAQFRLCTSRSLR